MQKFRSFDSVSLACVAAKLSALKRRRVVERAERRTASVLVPLVNVQGAPAVLFTVRSDTLSNHAGQVSFPGGHCDEGEDAIGAALRELHEELGLHCSRDAVLGLGHETISITDVIVTPVVAFVGSFQSEGELMERLVCSPHEVADAFSLSLANLSVHSHVETLTRKGQSVLARRYTGGRSDVWGLTALILSDLLRIALVDCAAAGSTADSNTSGGVRDKA